GRVDNELLERLNALPYYGQPYPKSLANEFGTETVLPLMRAAGLSAADALRTYVEHVAIQVGRAVKMLGDGGRMTDSGGRMTDGGGRMRDGGEPTLGSGGRVLVTGGGAHNEFLLERLRHAGVEVVVPEDDLVDYKEAL